MCAKHGKLRTRHIRAIKSQHRHPPRPRICQFVSTKIFAPQGFKKNLISH